MISEARRRLPELVRQVRKDPGTTVLITVRDEVVAELRAALPEPEAGAAARSLLELMRHLPRRRGARTDVSSKVKAHLYGAGTNSRYVKRVKIRDEDLLTKPLEALPLVVLRRRRRSVPGSCPPPPRRGRRLDVVIS